MKTGTDVALTTPGVCASPTDGGNYDRRTIYARSDGRTRQSLADGDRFTGGRRGVLCLVVLAAAAVARFQRGNGGRGTLALAGCGSVSAGIRGCAALRLGFRVDWARHASSGRSSATVG